MAVTLTSDVLFQYRRFTLYNSPYVAHDNGCAIDLYPEGDLTPSPVTGEVIDTKSVNAPPQPYAAKQDHLILIDTGDYIARLLHVDPTVSSGDTVALGDNLGNLVRAGFFAPWVPNHIHLGFRTNDQNPYRAAGSLPIEVDVEIAGLEWDGTGTVTETGETWARLDVPKHPAPGQQFVGLASGDGVLDGGFPHYDSGGLLGGETSPKLAGTTVGTVSGRDVDWYDCTVTANGNPVTGIALFCARDRSGIKLVGDDLDLSLGESVQVEVSCSEG